jgi:hypothetical protein
MSHRCLWPGCDRVVGDDLWGCKPHWYALPNTLRAWIGRTYRLGMDTDTHPTVKYCEAHAAALAWIEQQEAKQ